MLSTIVRRVRQYVAVSVRLNQLSRSVDLARDWLHEMEVREGLSRAHVIDLTHQLRRARDTIAVLYAGNLARSADGTVDVDRVIEAIVGRA